MKVVVSALGVALAAAASQAALLTFFGEDPTPGGSLAGMTNSQAARALFASNLVGVGTEDFESRPLGNANGMTLSFPGAGTATLSGPPSGGNAPMVVGGPNAGRFATSGSRYLTARPDSASGAPFTITFSQSVAAFGFYGTDIGDISGQLQLTLTGGGTTTLNVPHTVNGPSGAGLFFGIIATTGAETFTSVKFISNTTADAFGFDDMTIGSLQQVSVVPLPTAGAMGLAGLAFVGARRRRMA